MVPFDTERYQDSERASNRYKVTEPGSTFVDSLWAEGNVKQTYFPRAASAVIVYWRDQFRSQVTWGIQRKQRRSGSKFNYSLQTQASRRI